MHSRDRNVKRLLFGIIAGLFVIGLAVFGFMTISISSVSTGTGTAVETTSNTASEFPWDFIMVLVIVLIASVNLWAAARQDTKRKNDERAEKPKRQIHSGYIVGTDGELTEMIEDEKPLFDELPHDDLQR